MREQTQHRACKRTDFKLETLPAHLFMNFKVVDEHGRQLGEWAATSRSCRRELGGQARQRFQKLAASACRRRSVGRLRGSAGLCHGRRRGAGRTAGAAAKAGGARREAEAASAAPAAPAAATFTAWTFGELPELLEIKQGGQTLIGFPALVDKGAHVEIEVFDDPRWRPHAPRGPAPPVRAAVEDPMKFVEKNIPGLQRMGMQFMSLGTPEELRDQIVDGALDRACLQDPLPADAASFNSGSTRAAAG